MTRFRDLPGHLRYGANAPAGDESEQKVKEFMASIDRPVQEFGPKRVPTERGQALTWTPMVRHAPDFLGWGKFIEVQTCYSKSIVFKKDKLNVLKYWDIIMPVWFAVYVKKTDEIILASLFTVLWACQDQRTQSITLDKGTRGEKEAFEVPIEVMLEVMVNDAFAVDREIRRVNK
jgi:hypothetical protein